MASFSYTVDTQPMADEISTVSRRVDVTTGAVVAMQVAVIAAEEEASNHVCDNVNRGFYSLIRSQISQKVARLQSEVDSQLMQLNQQRAGLLGIKTRMQRDYNMITARYVKLFNGLNINLKSRVFELDKPTIDFVKKDVYKMSNRTRYLSATVPISQVESIAVSQKIIASNVKQRGANVINSMKTFIHEMNLQKKLTDQILINETSFAKAGAVYIPIAIYESNSDKADHKNIDINIPDFQIGNIAKSSIRNKVYNGHAELQWAENPAALSKISIEFNNLISKSAAQARVKEMALKLYQANKILSI
jgi:hypothetical protein